MVACTTTAKRYDYVSEYNESLELDGVANAELDYPEQFENLVNLFSDLKSNQIHQRIVDTYSNALYFNDTLHTFFDRDELSDYLIDGAQRVDEISVHFHDIASSGDNHYVRWVMEMKFKVMGKSIDSRSIGVSQIRFDDQGKINFQQDFWDNTSGFFGHLPVLGSLIARIKTSMK